MGLCLINKGIEHFCKIKKNENQFQNFWIFKGVFFCKDYILNVVGLLIFIGNLSKIICRKISDIGNLLSCVRIIISDSQRKKCHVFSMTF